MLARAKGVVRSWLVDVFATTIRRVVAPEHRQGAIDWLVRARDVVGDTSLSKIDKARALQSSLDAKASMVAVGGAVTKMVKDYRTAPLPLAVKVALPATLAALPLVGGQAAGIAAFGGAVGVPVALLIFLGVSGITAVIEAVARDPAQASHIAGVIAAIIEDERLRRTSAAMKAAMREQPADPARFAMPAEDGALRNELLAMDPFDFERHVMSFFQRAGLEAWTTRKSNDLGVDGFALHAEGLIIVQCKRNAPDNRVGRPLVQQFKGVAEEQGAWRAYLVTTSEFTGEARASAALSDRLVLATMADLVGWHRSPPAF